MATAHFLKLTYEQNRWLFDNHSVPAARLFLALKTYFPSNRPIPKITVSSMAEVSGMSRAACCRAFQELMDKGSISVRETVHHEVALHPVKSPRSENGTERSDNGTPDPVAAMGLHGSGGGTPENAPKAAPRSENGTPRSENGTERSDNGTEAGGDIYISSLKKKEEEEEELPISPSAPATAAAEPPQAAAEGEKDKPTKKPAARAATFRLTVTDIPLDLQPVADDLLDYWAEKKGARSAGAWRQLSRNLSQIMAHPQGGTDEVLDLLSRGIQGQWQSISFRKWLQIEASRRPVRLGNGSGGQYRTAREKQRDEVHDFLIDLAIADPEHSTPEYRALAQERLRTTQPSFIDVSCTHA